MIGIVLAAGKGERLRPLTADRPKALVELWDGVTLLEQVVGVLSPAVERVMVVAGSRAEQVREFVKERGLEVDLFINKNLFPGNLTSLLTVWPHLKNSPFILTNVDHIFPRTFFSNLLVMLEGRKGVFLAAQRKGTREIFEDEMKVKVESGNRLQLISKNLKDYDGAYIGVTVVTDTETYGRALDEVLKGAKIERACVEDILAGLVKMGCPPEVQWLDGVRWFEVDTVEDLKRARREMENAAHNYI